MDTERNQLSSYLNNLIEKFSELKKKREDEWDKIYELYRGRVFLNRLTQRQSISIPLMKYTIKTILKEIDDAPILTFRSLNQDEQKELFYNIFYEKVANDEKLMLKDITDKRQELLFGRTFKKINLENGKIRVYVIDPLDILISDDVDPTDLSTCSFFAQRNIFLNLSALKSDSRFDEDTLGVLERELKGKSNQEAYERKKERLRNLGYINVDESIELENDPLVSLTEVYFKKELDGVRQFFYGIMAQDKYLIYYAPLDTILGKTKGDYWKSNIPYVSWADDLDNSDFWSDGVGDIVKPAHIVLSSFISQLIENRSLRNLGMYFYNSQKDADFIPQTFIPRAFGFYPVPGDPNQILKPVEIPDISTTLNEINFLLNMTERATATTTTQQGLVNQQKITLGEVQLALTEAKARVRSISKFYNYAWQEFGEKFVKFTEGMKDKINAVKVSKKGNLTNKVYSQEINPDNWYVEEGYDVEVKSVVEGGEVEELQKLNYALSLMPNNNKLKEIVKKRALEFVGLNFAEIKEILDEEKKTEEISTTINEMVQPQPEVMQPNSLLVS